MLLLRAHLLEQARARRSHQVDLRHIFSMSYLQIWKLIYLQISVSGEKYALFCSVINGPLEWVNSGELSQAILDILSALSTQPVHSPEVAQPNYAQKNQPITDGEEAFLIGWSPLNQTAFSDGKQGRNFKKDLWRKTSWCSKSTSEKTTENNNTNIPPQL